MQAIRPRYVAAAVAGAALCLLTSMFAGCATEPLSMEVRADTQRSLPKIGHSVAFLHPQSFREHQEVITPYGAGGYALKLKAGEASDKALREIYPRLFAAQREVASRDEFARPAASDAPVALLEPSIVALHYLNASRRMEGAFYAQIVYRFTLTEAGGGSIANWFVRGFAQYNLIEEAKARTKDMAPAPRGEEGILAEAPRRAMEAGISSFGTSFERVPELIRWSHGQPMAGVDVPPEQQLTRDIGPPAPGVEAVYPAAFALRVQRTPLPTPPKELVEEAALEPRLLALRITLLNESSHRLALDPVEIEWDAGLTAPLEPLPPPVAAAAVTRLPFGLAVAPGVGVAALPALFAALISAAELERHRAEFMAWSAAVSSETLVDGIALGGETRTGLVYFPLPEKQDSGTLVVRIIDLDAAVRYAVRLPMPKP